RVSEIINSESNKNGIKIIVGGETVTLYFDQNLDLNQQKQKIDDEAPSILESPPKIEGGVLPLRNLEISGEPVQRKEGTGLSIPTVVGLSLRKAIQKLAKDGIKATVVGSGYVVRQIPTAGRPALIGDFCLIECRPLDTMADRNDYSME
ncbi:MAG: PASTA domain-containing protein, partial [Candidatus Latescibacteria bacterium]|nr:PASTA domain-containing protein [Candidatus Latescibacterota bacterium]